MAFNHNLSDWLGISIDDEWLEENMPHMHPGGEAYLVLRGEVYDDEGTYPQGTLVWMDPETTHNPKTREKTLILVLWPKGVKIV